MAAVDFLAILAMLLQQTINGGYTVLTAAALTSDDPIKPETFALVRDGGASILLLIAARVTTKEGELFWPKREHIGDFALIGLCGEKILRPVSTRAHNGIILHTEGTMDDILNMVNLNHPYLRTT